MVGRTSQRRLDMRSLDPVVVRRAHLFVQPFNESLYFNQSLGLRLLSLSWPDGTKLDAFTVLVECLEAKLGCRGSWTEGRPSVLWLPMHPEMVDSRGYRKNPIEFLYPNLPEAWTLAEPWILRFSILSCPDGTEPDAFVVFVNGGWLRTGPGLRREAWGGATNDWGYGRPTEAWCTWGGTDGLCVILTGTDLEFGIHSVAKRLLLRVGISLAKFWYYFL